MPVKTRLVPPTNDAVTTGTSGKRYTGNVNGPGVDVDDADVSSLLAAGWTSEIKIPNQAVTNIGAIRKAAAALAGAVAAPVVITGVGDSLMQMGGETTNQTTDTVDEQAGFLGCLRRELNGRLGLSAYDGGQWYPADAQPSDSRVTNGGGTGIGGVLTQWSPWLSFRTSGLGQTPRSTAQLSAVGHTLTWTVTNARFVTIYWWENAGTSFTATWSYTIDGGAATNVVSTGLTDTYRSITVDLTTQGTHTVKIDFVSGTKALIVGALATPLYGVAAARYAYGSTRTTPTGFISGTAASVTRNLTTTFNMLPSAVTIIRFGYNDWNNQGLDLAPSTFANNMLFLANQALANTATKAVILLTDPVSSTPDTKTYKYREYSEALKSIATGNIAYVDLAAMQPDYTTQNNMGLYVDFVHRTGAGHAIDARLLADIILGQDALRFQ